ncbi:MAG: hypothetical protein EXS46_03425, partial [Candidatus Taylorbacteria bacterium]|nr:hypothetical protein [Candidatus Taylorbacteria bacterium]
MSYIEQETKLNKVLETLPIPTEKLLNGETPIDLLYATGRDFELTINDIGELCELVQQIITKERKPEDFEAGLKEKLEFGDDTILVGNVLATVTQKIFLKLLPALNIKVPLDMAMATVVNPITTSPTSQEGVKGVEMIGDFDKTKDSNESADTPIQVSDLKFTGNLAQRAPKAGAPLPTFPQVSPEPPVQLTKPAVQVPLSSTIPLISNQSGETIPAKKPPMVEVSANQVPENSIESLMKMLRGSVSERELQTHLSKLPESLRVALESVDSAKKVVEIGQKYALHVDKIGDLATETGMVILGFTHPGQFLPRLTRRLGMNENTIRPLAQEINTEIFLKIREALKEINGEGGIHISPEPQAR